MLLRDPGRRLRGLARARARVLLVALLSRARRASRSSSLMGFVGDAPAAPRAVPRARRRASSASSSASSYYPALANQLSPKEVFESYRRLCPGAPLALLGVGGRTAAYYAGGQPQALNDPHRRVPAGSTAGRRRAPLPRDEGRGAPASSTSSGASTPRAAHEPPGLDARSSQILLAASSLGAGREEREPARVDAALERRRTRSASST